MWFSMVGRTHEICNIFLVIVMSEFIHNQSIINIVICEATIQQDK